VREIEIETETERGQERQRERGQERPRETERERQREVKRDRERETGRERSRERQRDAGTDLADVDAHEVLSHIFEGHPECAVVFECRELWAKFAL
jgi:hypothetical protein